MLTKNEITALNLSPTKKDFVQIWNELLEVAGKLSERWDPTSTNESDPGIVILKALTGIADKLNYNIDKNTLEAFMPTAAQEDSMRKLCDMLGYNIKYYRSAETEITIKYHNSDPTADEEAALTKGLLIPKFTVITNSDQDVNYFTINPDDRYIFAGQPITEAIPCMEGQIVKCESTSDNNVITASQITEQNRFYLPEYQIAENGIFVYNVAANTKDGARWTKVDNLNIQARGERVFKFGYDSYESRPYIEFPEDYSELINDGLFIYYTRTSGANGNISARTLTQLELPSGEGWDKVSAESFSVENAFSATSGTNIETIDQAYNNFKKTVGTFETLVTCRDYMNKIYTMTNANTGKALVSNILATDIRTDLNRAVTICSCDDAGIFYKDTPLTATTVINTTIDESTSTEPPEISVEETWVASAANKPVYRPLARYAPLGNWASGAYITRFANWCLGSQDGMSIFNDKYSKDLVDNEDFDSRSSGTVTEYNDNGTQSDYWRIIQNGKSYTTKLKIDWVKSTKTIEKKTVTETVTEQVKEDHVIDHFDLVLYPFKSYNQIRGSVKDIQNVYDASFNYSEKDFGYIKDEFDKSDSSVKTIAHNIIKPREQDILSINNYLRLNAIIGTHSKMSTEECTLLIDTIKIALANAFNMRELDFGEEIPFESIVNVIENADSRIKVVSLAEPALYTTFSVLDGYENETPILREYAVASDWLTEEDAVSAGRFEYGDSETGYIHTFDTQKAKDIYNKLAVRNVLAGRVPLFKYNTTFKTSFSEGAYQITTKLNGKPNLSDAQIAPDEANPFKIYADGTTIYTGQLIETPSTDPDTGDTSTEKSVVYTKTYTPTKYIDSLIAKDKSTDNTTDNITKIKTSCKVKVNVDTTTLSPSVYSVTDLTLAAGEVIKFRAPNFVTNKTFPAYVNYHLSLNTKAVSAARSAKAYTLYDLLNKQLNGQGATANTRRQSVLDYFGALGHKKTFELSQKVYKKVNENLETDDNLVIQNPTEIISEDTPEKILARSGFVKLISTTATLAWEGLDDGTKPEVEIPELNLGDTLFIATSGVFTDIKTQVNNCLWRLNSQTPNPMPDKADWTISYKFEYVPFEEATLVDWENFIKANGKVLFGFEPEDENGNVLWHTTVGGYAAGSKVLANTSKLLTFTRGDFGYLESAATRLLGVYVSEDLGADQRANFISNDEEYMLRDGEHLYIEYTPSSSTDSSSAQAQESVKEILGPGTIIKPSGFENGLIDSAVYIQNGNTAPKTIDFKDAAGIPMLSLGASEQIAIRDFAQVVLNKGALPNASNIYVYKNFDCLELESNRYANKYILKDGEYIFYTDQNQAEFAYFTTGTEVELTGGLVLPKFEKIDLATIFDNGIHEIPWSIVNLSNGEGIIFKEFQYITLGDGDTVKALYLPEYTEILDENWQSCHDVVYIPAGSTEESKLPKINTDDSFNNGTGWEVCSVLELNVSPNSSQTLRKTDKIETSITLYKENGSGDGDIVLEAGDVTMTNSEQLLSDYPLEFKTNLSCQTTGNQLKISDLYSNPNNLKSFELRIFAATPPSIIKTAKGSLAPYKSNNSAIVDLAAWPTEQNLSINDFGSLWKPVALTSFTSADQEHDSALKLSATILPDTYGIFSIYLNYHEDEKNTTKNSVTEDTRTWIEILPGSSKNDITLFNGDPIWEGPNKTQLLLRAGINCIRVNKTGSIFIKTNAKSGALYFDNIRLVDCQTIEYVKDGNKISQVTQGLNLAQIGYLDTTNEQTFGLFDMRIRKKLKDEFTENALTALEARKQEEFVKFEEAWKTILASKTKLQAMTKFIATAKTELNDLSVSGVNIAGLFEKYKEVYEDWLQEKDLKTALDNNKNIDELEQRLITVLENFVSTEEAQQSLLNELDRLESAASQNVGIFDKNALSKSDILDDFETVANTELYTQLVTDLKLASIKEINAEYLNKLTEISKMVDDSVNGEAQQTLLTILEDLNAYKYAELIVQIDALIETNQNTLTQLLSDATSDEVISTDENGNYIVEYNTLTTILLNIREQLSSIDVKALINKIELVFNSSMATDEKHAQLSSLVEELLTLLETDAAAVGNYVSLITATNDILVKTQAKIEANDTAYDATIFALIDALKVETTKVNNTKLKNILADMQEVLDKLEKRYVDAVSTLDEDDEVLGAIIDSLRDCVAYRDDQIATVTNFGTASDFDIQQAYFDLPFGTSAVLTIWPAYMKRSFIAGVDKLCKDIRKAIASPDMAVELIVDPSFETNESPKKLRKVLKTTANLEAFQALFEQAKDQIPQYTQNSARRDLINDLGALILPSDAMSDAMEDILADDTANRNAVICQLITELKSNPNVTQKQQIIKALKDELNTVIEIDKQLVEISAKLLCPSILLFEQNLPEIADSSNPEKDFFIELRNFAANQRENLIESYGATIGDGTDGQLLNQLVDINNILEALSVAVLKEDITKFESLMDENLEELLENALLSTEFITLLKTIQGAQKIQNLITEVKTCKLFKILERDLTVALETTKSYLDKNHNQQTLTCWVDSAGNGFKKYLTIAEKSDWYSFEQYVKVVLEDKSADWTIDAWNTIWADGTWSDTNGYWRTNSDEKVKVDFMYQDNTWLASDGNVVTIREDFVWFVEGSDSIEVFDNDLNTMLSQLLADTQALSSNTISDTFRDTYSTWLLEEQLLAEIRSLDTNNIFYYNVPVESNVAIDFNEGDTASNTLLNPAVNYDINNVNNNFVISKIDINYLTNGLQIARSSKIN